MTTLIIIFSILIVLATTEVQIWGFTINRHAWWMKNNPHLEKRRINYKSLFWSSIFTAVLSLMMLLAWMITVMMIATCTSSYVLICLFFFVGFGSSAVLISYLSLISKLCGLNKYYYPPLSSWVCGKIKRALG